MTLIAVLAFAVLLVVMIHDASSARAELDIVVPAYFYPGGAGLGLWNQMNSAAGQVPLTAIMNPGNGPGTFQDSNYMSVVNSLRAAGGRVIGYVYTSYGSRPLAEVLADVDRYDTFYNVDGIFVDEMANTGPSQRLNYYKSIYDHVKSIDSNWEVMGNPGTNTIELYLTWPTADRLMVFEGFGSSYPAYTPSSWNFDYDSSHFVHLVHQESSGNLQADLNLAVARNAGGIYVTGDVLPNPWDTLPSYWSTEVAAVAEINSSFLDGDFNENGTVDGSDLARWTEGYGTGSMATHKMGDSDSDGDVDGRDFLAWQRQYGESSLSLSALNAQVDVVPEPNYFPWWAITLALVFRPNPITHLRCA